MFRNEYLYRRPSGIYVVRICVPKRLQSLIGRREIHISTSVRDPALAKSAFSASNIDFIPLIAVPFFGIERGDFPSIGIHGLSQLLQLFNGLISRG